MTLEVLKENIPEAFYNIQQCEFQQVSWNLFKRIQAGLTADIMNIFYHGQYNINYYIWLIINKRRKQCVLALFSASGAALSQEVADGKINVQLACIHVLLNTLV
jgi:hypothetical protein